MRKILYFLIFLFLFACNNSKEVYWCGDHPCINKKEKEAYFAKTMIVEIKDLNKNIKDKESEIDKLIQQAKSDQKKMLTNEKKLAKKAKLEEKKKIKEEKKLAKELKLRKKKQIKEEKELARLIEIEEKKRNKRKNMPKKTAKLKENDNKNVYSNNPSKIMQLGHNKFNALVKKIIQQNDNKPYPEINNIPE